MADSSKPPQPVKDALKVIMAFFFLLRTNYLLFLSLVPAITAIHLYVLDRVKFIISVVMTLHG